MVYAGLKEKSRKKGVIKNLASNRLIIAGGNIKIIITSGGAKVIIIGGNTEAIIIGNIKIIISDNIAITAICKQ